MTNPTDQASSTDRPERNPEITAIETIGAVLTDLVEIAGQLPVPGGRIDQIARILDRLSEEIAEAAAMLRRVPR
jgi:hypothetical protein